MATYYGMGPDGQMGHIRLKETLEDWHLRCAEDHERIRQLRSDIPRGYSWKALLGAEKADRQRIQEINGELENMRVVLSTLAEGLSLVAEILGIPVQFAPVVDGQLRLPCPEHGEECALWPDCTS